MATVGKPKGIAIIKQSLGDSLHDGLERYLARQAVPVAGNNLTAAI